MRADIVRIEVARLKAEFPDVWEEDADMILDVLEGQTEFVECLTYLVDQEKEAKALEKAVQERIDSLVKRKQRFKQRQEGTRSMMLALMDDAGQRKVELPEATVSVRHVAPKVIITSEDELPDNCCTFKRVPNKTAIKVHINEEGGVTGATLSNGYDTISIR